MERIRARLFSIHSCMENKLTHVIMIESIIQSVPFLKWLWFVYDWIGTKFGGCNCTLIDYPALALATTWQLSSPYLNTTNWSRRPTELSKAMTRPFSSKKPIAVAVFQGTQDIVEGDRSMQRRAQKAEFPIACTRSRWCWCWGRRNGGPVRIPCGAGCLDGSFPGRGIPCPGREWTRTFGPFYCWINIRKVTVNNPFFIHFEHQLKTMVRNLKK